LAEAYRAVRQATLGLVAPLSAEDCAIQSMPDASPAKWHLAHTTWFFETFVLQPHVPGYRVFDADYGYLFNSYYNAIGKRHPRPERGMLSRPSLEEVLAYRRHVDGAVLDARELPVALVELGLHHEQQHQELILTDVLHALSCNSLLPAYGAAETMPLPSAEGHVEPEWISMPGGAVQIGHSGAAFAFDNETPRHPVLLAPYCIADRLVTCGDYALFIADGGYERPMLWLSDGWAAAQAGGWKHPLYWIAPGDARAPTPHWQVFGLGGVQPLDHAAPVTQLSFYEAAAYAQWAGARLPTEFEWEAAFDAPGMRHMTGHAWQWTRSSYDPYPGFRPLAGAVGEYNGKFMVGQIVLRGGSVATPEGHTRATYRNFFPPAARWQFSGLRLARDGSC
jgi:ergothioneine biosynthesis protein EgtB